MSKPIEEMDLQELLAKLKENIGQGNHLNSYDLNYVKKAALEEEKEAIFSQIERVIELEVEDGGYGK